MILAANMSSSGPSTHGETYKTRITWVSWLTWVTNWATSLSLAFQVQLKWRNPSSAFQPTCLTFFWVWTKRDSWWRARVCLLAHTVPSCDLMPSWQQNPLNWGPLSHKGSAGYTHTAHTHSTPDCRPPTAHLAHCYYVTMCVCVRTCVCETEIV